MKQCLLFSVKVSKSFSSEPVISKILGMYCVILTRIGIGTKCGQFMGCELNFMNVNPHKLSTLLVVDNIIPHCVATVALGFDGHSAHRAGHLELLLGM